MTFLLKQILMVPSPPDPVSFRLVRETPSYSNTGQYG